MACTAVLCCLLAGRRLTPCPCAACCAASLSLPADVGVGAWLVGLDIQYDNQHRLCCDNEWKCTAQVCMGDGSVVLSRPCGPGLRPCPGGLLRGASGSAGRRQLKAEGCA